MEKIGSSLPVRFAVLGFLCERSLHGYELAQRIERGLGALWRIATSQLYAVLHRLEALGLATAHVEELDARPARTVYRITDEGREAFEQWLRTPVAHLRDMRVEFLAKVYFLRRRASEGVNELMDAQVELLTEAETGIRSRDGIQSDDRVFGLLVASFRQHGMESMVAWLQAERDRIAFADVGGKEEE